jgi:hypothetical protein
VPSDASALPSPPVGGLPAAGRRSAGDLPGRLPVRDRGAAPSGHGDQSLGLQERHGAMGGTGGDGVLGGELDDGGQLVARPELAGLDLGPAGRRRWTRRAPWASSAAAGGWG